MTHSNSSLNPNPVPNQNSSAILFTNPWERDRIVPSRPLSFRTKTELDIDHGGDEEEEEDEDDYNICNSWMIQLYLVAKDGGVFVVVGWLDLNSTFGKAAAQRIVP